MAARRPHWLDHVPPALQLERILYWADQRAAHPERDYGPADEDAMVAMPSERVAPPALPPPPPVYLDATTPELHYPHIDGWRFSLMPTSPGERQSIILFRNHFWDPFVSASTYRLVRETVVPFSHHYQTSMMLFRWPRRFHEARILFNLFYAAGAPIERCRSAALWTGPRNRGVSRDLLDVLDAHISELLHAPAESTFELWIPSHVRGARDGFVKTPCMALMNPAHVG